MICTAVKKDSDKCIYNNIYFDTNFLVTSLKILDNIDYWGFRSNIKFLNTIVTHLIKNTFNSQTFSLRTSRLNDLSFVDGQNSEYSSHRLAGRMAYSCKKKKSSA